MSLVADYLARIGADRPLRTDEETLRYLHARHLATVPFENLDIHLGVPIELTTDAMLDKLVKRRRGGFCYELNGSFAHLLTELGFRVEMLSAGVFQAGVPGPPFDHMALVVHLDEPWLADVGFGRHSTFPLRLSSRAPQEDPDGTFLLRSTEDGDLDVLRDGTPEYRLDPRPRRLTDFVPTCWYQQTSPDSGFRRGPTCSIAVPGGRITLAGDRLIRTMGGARTEEVLHSEAEILAAYHEHFGFELPRVPSLS
ncbi:arylamine N-acetyltransferase [Allokutzneria sp. A3M-2-11 16]|uniref:arylamine N-acetyltransferase family protein n=1 Tax=Allokutzneria sp. A3M-2-11 16 TaxID=2962043 RepID=UPI0020B8AD2D|nr:arylamine N-acetyltransferase [Allokutzneria sp. A3M-2-11 16]MCP3802402.1 arylamine N-acetyltransferase [Allokutzneria sp. A3M-2-11 16]